MQISKDGFHIRLLAITDFIEIFEQFVVDGRLYIAQAPLYRVTSSGKKPMYFKTSKELNDFFSNESEKNFTFFENDAELTKDKAKKRVFNECRNYCSAVEAVSARYRISPHIYEQVFLMCFDPESLEFAFNDKKMKVELNDAGQISITGFHRDEASGEENFVALINEDAEEFFDSLSTIFNDHYLHIAGEIDIHYKGGTIDENSMYKKINIINDRLNRIYKVLRFKGLGEANSDELWETTMDPSKRELIQITMDDVEEAKNTVANFMSSSRVQFRKDFLNSMFDVVDKEALSY